MQWIPIIAIIISCLSLLVGSGVIIHAMGLAKKWGQFSEMMTNLKGESDRHKQIDSENDKQIKELERIVIKGLSETKADVSKSLRELESSLAHAIESKIIALHSRLNEMQQETTTNKNSIQGFLRDIETLLQDVRELLKDSASTGADMRTLKSRIEKIEERITDLQQRVSGLEARYRT